MAEIGLIYPELSYKIIGIAFRIFNEIGFGMNEKFYQKVFAKELEKEKLSYEKEKKCSIKLSESRYRKLFFRFSY